MLPVFYFFISIVEIPTTRQPEPTEQPIDIKVIACDPDWEFQCSKPSKVCLFNKFHHAFCWKKVKKQLN